MKIYKFRSLDRTLINGSSSYSRAVKIIETGSIWCPRPSSLNDVFEISPIFDKEFDDDAFFAYREWRLNSGIWNINTAREMEASYHLSKKAGLEIDFSSDINELLANLQTIGVCSMSQNCNSPLLWGIYAENAAGIAIEFDIPDSEIGNTFFSVEYQTNRPVIKVSDLIESMYNNHKRDKLHQDIVRTKSVAWEKENEIRCIIEQGDREAKVAGDAKRILFGPKAKDQDIEEIIKAFPNIPYSTMTVSEMAYDIIQV